MNQSCRVSSVKVHFVINVVIVLDILVLVVEVLPFSRMIVAVQKSRYNKDRSH
jgi:hypothetical protein